MFKVSFDQKSRQPLYSCDLIKFRDVDGYVDYAFNTERKPTGTGYRLRYSCVRDRSRVLEFRKLRTNSLHCTHNIEVIAGYKAKSRESFSLHVLDTFFTSPENLKESWELL